MLEWPLSAPNVGEIGRPLSLTWIERARPIPPGMKPKLHWSRSRSTTHIRVSRRSSCDWSGLWACRNAPVQAGTPPFWLTPRWRSPEFGRRSSRRKRSQTGMRSCDSATFYATPTSSISTQPGCWRRSIVWKGRSLAPGPGSMPFSKGSPASNGKPRTARICDICTTDGWRRYAFRSQGCSHPRRARPSRYNSLNGPARSTRHRDIRVRRHL